MNYLLPFRQNIPSLIQRTWDSIRGRFSLIAVLNVFLVLLIATHSVAPAKRMAAPVLSSFSVKAPLSNIGTKETFAFIPGQAQNKYDQIDFQNLGYISFFDLPLDDNGQISPDTRGYNSFKSDATASLIDTAHNNKTKFLVTLTATDSGNIESLLDSNQAQDDLISQAVGEVQNSGIDGVTIDFEPNQPINSYSGKLANFISRFKTAMHNAVPNSVVAVAVPSSATNSGFYDTKALSQSSDKVMMIAANLIVPEEKNGQLTKPVYGYSDSEYKTNLAQTLTPFQTQAQPNKLVLERAWYGSGDNYPLYDPQNKPADANFSEPAQVNLDQSTIDSLVAEVPPDAQGAARQNIPLIGKALQNEGILDPNVLAYALATVEHETDGTFRPIDEIQGRLSARRLGYEGGENYFGRGFLQLTHLRNYKVMGERIGMGDSLVKDPTLASTPEVAAKILAAYFKDNNVASLASQGQFIAARQMINPDANGWSVSQLAQKYEI